MRKPETDFSWFFKKDIRGLKKDGVKATNTV